MPPINRPRAASAQEQSDPYRQAWCREGVGLVRNFLENISRLVRSCCIFSALFGIKPKNLRLCGDPLASVV